jgi:hypothetical protein
VARPTIGQRQWIERQICCVLQPLTGARAFGTATVKAIAGDVVLPGGSYAAACITDGDGVPRDVTWERLFKTRPAAVDAVGEWDCTTADITVTAAGVEVPIMSATGGAAMNLPLGTKILWTPFLPGIEPISEVTTACTGGAAPALALGSVVQVVGWDEAGVRSKDPLNASTFRSRLSGGSGVIVAWVGSGRGERTGTRLRLRPNLWRCYVIVSDFTGSEPRKTGGLAVLDHLDALLEDRSSADGEGFSAPHTAVTRGGLLMEDDSSYVYVSDVETSNTLHGIDARTFTDWQETQAQIHTLLTLSYPELADALGVNVSFLQP